MRRRRDRIRKRRLQLVKELWRSLSDDQYFSAVLLLGEALHLENSGILDLQGRQFFDEISHDKSLFYIITDASLRKGSREANVISSDFYGYSREDLFPPFSLSEEEKELILNSMSMLCRELSIELDIPYEKLPVILLIDKESEDFSVLETGPDIRFAIGHLYYEYYAKNKNYFRVYDERRTIAEKNIRLGGDLANHQKEHLAIRTKIKVLAETIDLSAQAILENQDRDSHLIPEYILLKLEEEKEKYLGNIKAEHAFTKIAFIEETVRKIVDTNDFRIISNLFHVFAKKSKALPFLHELVMGHVKERFRATRSRDEVALKCEIDFLCSSLISYKKRLVDFYETPISQHVAFHDIVCMARGQLIDLEKQLNSIESSITDLESKKLSLNAEYENVSLQLSRLKYFPLTKFGVVQSRFRKIMKADAITRSLLDHPLTKIIVDITKKIMLK